MSEAGATDGRVSWRTLLRRPEFVAYLAARGASDFGDKLAKVAISISALVSTGSVLAAAAVFAVSTLPSVFADALLSPMADRLPRRTLMVACDLARALVVLAVLGLVLLNAPLWLILIAVFLVEVIAAPFYAAGAGLMATMLPGPHELSSGNSLRWVVQLVAMIAGWAAGGALVILGGVRLALLVDVATFVLSAVLLSLHGNLRRGLRRRGRSLREQPLATVKGLFGSPVTEAVTAWRAVASNGAVRSALRASWWSGAMLVVPGALALPMAQLAGQSPAAGALLLAAEAFGMAVGLLVIGRQPLASQLKWCRLMVLGCAVALMASAALVGAWPALLLAWAMAGLFSAFTLPLATVVIVLSPDAVRGRVAGLETAGYAVVQSVGFLVAGAIADLSDPRTAVVVVAATGLLVAVGLGSSRSVAAVAKLPA